ncbi:hypothetical protein [Specibacter sp. NPDC078692]|uniref:hypothetical protein n=1 Tax=Specibacter sp. NPDC078692 TaxID=3155818 RepID=UPI003436B323
MSIYSDGTAAYRETTKWLTAFVPLTAMVASILTLGPPVLRSIQDAPSLPAWIGEHTVVLLCIAVLFGGLTVILSFGTKVLSVEPQDIGPLLNSPEKRSELAAVIGTGTTAPWFLDLATFNEALGEIAKAPKDPNSPPRNDTSQIDQFKLAVEVLRDWSLYHEIQIAFRNFLRAFIASTIAIAIAALVAPAQLESVIPVDKPTLVSIEVNESGQNDLLTRTGCTDPTASTFTAIGGSWKHPELAVDGPGCAFGAAWHPRRGHIELRLPSLP